METTGISKMLKKILKMGTNDFAEKLLVNGVPFEGLLEHKYNEIADRKSVV